MLREFFEPIREFFMRRLCELAVRNSELSMEAKITFTVSEAEGYGDEARSEIRRALQLIELVDERRLKRIQRHVAAVVAGPLHHFARYVSKSRVCVVDYRRMKNALGEGEALDDMLARLIVSCSVNALLETKGVDLSPYPVDRIHDLCDTEILRFARAVEAYNERKAMAEADIQQSRSDGW